MWEGRFWLLYYFSLSAKAVTGLGTDCLVICHHPNWIHEGNCLLELSPLYDVRGQPTCQDRMLAVNDSANHWYARSCTCHRAVKIAPTWRLNICSRKTHRFEPCEYLYLCIMSITGGQINTTRHNYLYRYFQDTVPWFQFLTKLSDTCAINNTDWPHVLSYERSKFICARLLSRCRQRACGGRWKIWVETWLFSWSSRHDGMLIWVHIFEICPHVACGGMVS